MGERGRKSAAELAASSANYGAPPLEPPSSLSNAERSLFIEIVTACPRRHFLPTDLPLLVSYIHAVVLSRETVKTAATNKNALMAWEKSVRVQAALATKLRLTPSSRYDPKTAARMPPPIKPLWLDDDDTND